MFTKINGNDGPAIKKRVTLIILRLHSLCSEIKQIGINADLKKNPPIFQRSS